ncbi:MAG: hypothetical protein GF350_11985 [Chitinivibrionales bacterium]|nr:hypothetical protein [Chitinivibrionales bacterium]
MAYKVMFKRKGDNKWLTSKTDDYSRNQYFKSRSEAQKYANSLTSFQTKVVSTQPKKRHSNSVVSDLFKL